jgi:hypothetical protein
MLTVPDGPKFNTQRFLFHQKKLWNLSVCWRKTAKSLVVLLCYQPHIFHLVLLLSQLDCTGYKLTTVAWSCLTNINIMNSWRNKGIGIKQHIFLSEYFYPFFILQIQWFLWNLFSYLASLFKSFLCILKRQSCCS